MDTFDLTKRALETEECAWACQGPGVGRLSATAPTFTDEESGPSRCTNAFNSQISSPAIPGRYASDDHLHSRSSVVAPFHHRLKRSTPGGSIFVELLGSRAWEIFGSIAGRGARPRPPWKKRIRARLQCRKCVPMSLL